MVRDKYLYPNTDVLINKFNIKDSKKLDKVEYTYVSLNITYIIDNPIKINSVFDICIIHKFYLEIFMNGLALLEI